VQGTHFLWVTEINGPRLSLNRANRTYSLLCGFLPGSWPFLKARSILRLEPTPAGNCIRPMKKFDWTQFVHGV